jgi:heme exporter protein D
MNGSEFSWSEFFAMGGYAFFVWTSYGITLLVILLNIVMPVLHRRKVINRVKRAIRREQLQQ